MLKASIDIDLLRDSITALSVIVSEVRLKIKPDGISVKAVDAANVAMVIFDLKAGAFNSYLAEETEVGIDLVKLNDIFGIVEKNTLVDMELDMASQKLHLNFGGLSYTLSLLDPSTIRSEPRVPQLDLPARIVLNGQDLKRAVKAAEKISDHMTLGVSGEIFYMEARGDTDQVRLEMTADQLIDLKSGEANSLFSLDYLLYIVKSAGKASEVTLSIGCDFPILIEFDAAPNTCHITFLLAPRIESD
ncbi:MAG: DNA polymerase sliding clamp [Methanosarcinales archaeon]|jgi:proliferating cell nuclear antigen|nr:DNA polymerase sliding clamp [Methanosarcinales archaeon]